MPLLGMPTKPVGLYFETYYGTQPRIITMPNPTDNPSGYYNVIFLFHALPTEEFYPFAPLLPGAVKMRRGNNTATLNADIATCRARGQRVIMTIGGAGGQVDVTDETTANRLIQSVKDENVRFGGSGTTAVIDGIDFNSYEGAAASGQWITYVALKLKAYYGSNFLITSPPAVHGQISGQAVLDRAVLAEMHAGGTQDGYTGTALDWMCAQNYDGPGNDNTSAVRTAMTFYNTAVPIPLHNGNIEASSQIPKSKIGIGFAISTLTNYWTTAEAVTCYQTMVSEGKNPRGAFNFSSVNNPSFSFATTVAPVILEGAGESGTLTTIQRIRGRLVASVQTIRGRAIAQVQSWRGKT